MFDLSVSGSENSFLVKRSFNVTRGELFDLFRGLWSVVVITEFFPSGELVGQFETVQCQSTNLTTGLSGTGSSGTGFGAVLLSHDEDCIAANVLFSGGSGSVLSVDLCGPANSSVVDLSGVGPVLFSLTDVGSGSEFLYVGYFVSRSLVDLVKLGETYLRVSTSAFVAGEVGGFVPGTSFSFLKSNCSSLAVPIPVGTTTTVFLESARSSGSFLFLDIYFLFFLVLLQPSLWL